MMTDLLRVGISRCLLGDEVRFDGGHKRDQFLTEVLGRYVEWVPVCPEVEAGLGIPREAMRLVGHPKHARIMGVRSGTDYTPKLKTMAAKRLEELADLNLSGFVFKKDSPSCGIDGVRIDDEHGVSSRKGMGLFAKAFAERFPLVPIEEEGRLHDPDIREHFIERLFCYRRYQNLLKQGVTRGTLVRFHTIHKYLLLAHSPPHYEMLGRLVGEVERYRSKEVAVKYGVLFMEALSIKTTVRKHVNVLEHILGYFSGCLTAREKSELLGAIENYHRGRTSLIVPLTLFNHYARIFDVGYIRDQIYLDSHPRELMFYNRV